MRTTTVRCWCLIAALTCACSSSQLQEPRGDKPAACVPPGAGETTVSHPAFERANRLWFHEGRTRRAVAAYETARKADPADPLVAFQLARVLWSIDRFDDARALLERAHAHRNRLTRVGREVVAEWREDASHPPPRRGYPGLPPELLDRDRLGSRPRVGWLRVADAASARRMWGLAHHAFQHIRGPVDHDLAKDMDRVETMRHADEAMLAQMVPKKRRPKKRARGRPSRSKAGRACCRGVHDPHPSSSASRASVAASAAPTKAPALPELPLELTARVLPASRRPGVETILVATLRNPSRETWLVNRRMLLGHRQGGGPSEVWFEVHGPPGYENTRGFRVRAGAAGHAGHRGDGGWRLPRARGGGFCGARGAARAGSIGRAVVEAERLHEHGPPRRLRDRGHLPQRPRALARWAPDDPRAGSRDGALLPARVRTRKTQPPDAARISKSFGPRSSGSRSTARRRLSLDESWQCSAVWRHWSAVSLVRAARRPSHAQGAWRCGGHAQKIHPCRARRSRWPAAAGRDARVDRQNHPPIGG